MSLLKRGARTGPWDALPAAVVQLAEAAGVAGVCIGPDATAAAQPEAVSTYLQHDSVHRLALHCMPQNVLPVVTLRACPTAAHIVALDISRLPGGLPVSAIPDALRAVFSCPNLQHAGVTLVDAAIATLPPHNMDHLPSLDEPAAPRPASAAPRRARTRVAPRRTTRRASDVPASAAPEPVLQAFLQELGNAPPSLRSLSLAGSGLTSSSIRALLLTEEPRAAHAWRQLHHLDLSGIQLRAEGVDAVACALVEQREFTGPVAAPKRATSRTARARSPRAAEVGVEPAKSAQLAALQSLSLAGCCMQGQAGDADSLLLQLPGVPQLRRVDLRGNRLDDAAVSTLCTSLAGAQGPGFSDATLPVLWPYQVQSTQSAVASNIEHLLSGVQLPSVPAGLWVLDVRDNAMTERGWHATTDALEACPALLYATGDGVSGSALWSQPRALLDVEVSQAAHRAHTLVAFAQAGEAAARAGARATKPSSRPGSRASSPTARSRAAARTSRAGAAKPASLASSPPPASSPPQPVPRPLTESVPAPRPPPQHHIDASVGQVPPHVAQRLARIAQDRWPAWRERHALVVQAEHAAQSTALPVYIGCDAVPLAEQQGAAGPQLPSFAEGSPVMQAAMPAMPSTNSRQWASLGSIRQAVLPAYCCGWPSAGAAAVQHTADAVAFKSWDAAAAAGDITAEQGTPTPAYGRTTLTSIAGPPGATLQCPVLLWRSCALVQGDLTCHADEVKVDWRLCAAQDKEHRVCAMGAWSRAHTTVQAALQAANQLAAAAAAQPRADDAWVLGADADFPARATTPWSVATGDAVRSAASGCEPAVYTAGWVALPLCHLTAGSAACLGDPPASGHTDASDAHVAMSLQTALASAAVIDVQACATLPSGTASPCTVTALVDSVCIVHPS